MVVLDLLLTVLDLLLPHLDEVLHVHLLVLLFVCIGQFLLISLLDGFLHNLVQFLNFIPQLLVDALQLINLDAKIKIQCN